jgi:hypothetical protein
LWRCAVEKLSEAAPDRGKALLHLFGAVVIEKRTDEVAAYRMVAEKVGDGHGGVGRSERKSSIAFAPIVLAEEYPVTVFAHRRENRGGRCYRNDRALQSKMGEDREHRPAFI